MAKITLSTIKSFIKKADALYINVTSKFDGMTDCCQDVKDGFTFAKRTNENTQYNHGIVGAWFVGSSRDYFTAFENEDYKGFEVSNCCGNFILAETKIK